MQKAGTYTLLLKAYDYKDLSATSKPVKNKSIECINCKQAIFCKIASLM